MVYGGRISVNIIGSSLRFFARSSLPIFCWGYGLFYVLPGLNSLSLTGQSMNENGGDNANTFHYLYIFYIKF